MDDVTFLLSIFGLFALLIGVVFYFFGRWGRILAVGMLVVWCYQAQWYARVVWNPELVKGNQNPDLYEY